MLDPDSEIFITAYQKIGANEFWRFPTSGNDKKNMKIIVTHTSPDWDAIASVWLLKRFLEGWEEAVVQFVPAGERITRLQEGVIIDVIDDKEIIHVDTGLGPLDHHQTPDKSVCGASRTWDYVKTIHSGKFQIDSDKWTQKAQAIDRIVKVVVAIDHFREVFWPEADADYQEFSLIGLLEGLKIQKQDADGEYVEIGMGWLDTMLHNFESRVWAEREIKEKGVEFETKSGKGLAIATLNDGVIKLAQKMGYMVVIRKDPRKGYVRIKARPDESDRKTMDLTLAYEKIQKMDPNATWFLHVSKKMLLNGGSKNPRMNASKLSLEQLISVVKDL